MKEIQKKRLEKRILLLMAEIYFRELKNPAIGFATFTRVELNEDLSKARIFVSVMEDAEGRKETMRALRNASGFVRGIIGRRIRMRNVPQIEFIPDKTLETLDGIPDHSGDAGQEEE